MRRLKEEKFKTYQNLVKNYKHPAVLKKNIERTYLKKVTSSLQWNKIRKDSVTQRRVND